MTFVDVVCLQTYLTRALFSSMPILRLVKPCLVADLCVGVCVWVSVCVCGGGGAEETVLEI